MSYRCQITGKVSRQGDPRTGEWMYVSDVEKADFRAPEKLNKIVVATRPKVYTRWFKNEETNQWYEAEVARGFETVQELNVSEEGMRIWESWSDSQRDAFLKRLNAKSWEK